MGVAVLRNYCVRAIMQRLLYGCCYPAKLLYKSHHVELLYDHKPCFTNVLYDYKSCSMGPIIPNYYQVLLVWILLFDQAIFELCESYSS